MAYATVVQLQGYAGIEDDRHNALLGLLIERAQAWMEEYVGFTFEASADSTRTFDAKSVHKGGNVDGRTLVFDTWCYSLTTVVNGDDTTITSTYYVTEPRNDAPYYAITLKSSSGYTWESDANADYEDAISVTGRWGYSTTPPADIVHACLRLSLWLYRQRDNSTDLDRPLLAEGVTILPSAIPRDVIDTLERYRWRGAV